MLINSPNISGSLNVSGNTVITGSLTTSIAALNTAATTFLTSDGGTIKSRTAAQTLSDIGAQPTGSYLTISSATGSYVPYTGATGTVNLGFNSLAASRIRIDGNAPTAGSHLGFKQATNVNVGDGGYTSISTFGTNTMTFSFAQPTGFKNFSFNVFGITQDVPGGRVYTMPDESGTLALTSNLGSYLPLTGGGAITGSLIVTGGITGNVTGSATTASYVEYNNVANKPTLLSGSVQIRDFGIFATTGSNQFNGSQSITGSLTVSGQVIAQTLNVQEVTSSIVYSSGSNVFGNSVSNTQQFTGSVKITGSLSVTTNGVELQVTNTGVNIGNSLTDSHIISGSLRVNPNGLFVSGSGNVGVGTTSPLNKLSVLVDGGGADDGIRIGVGSQGDGIKIVQRYLSDRVVATLGQSNYGVVTDSGALRLYDVGGTETVRFSGKNGYPSFITSGNVGIGTSLPSTQLNVGHESHGVGISYLGGNALPALAGIFTSDGTAGGQTGYGSLLIKARSDFGGFYSINFFTAASNNTSLERMRITSSGNVGIGTSTPSTRLDIGNGTLTLPTLRGRTYELSNVSSANPNFINGTGFNSIPVRVGDIIDLPFSQTRTVTAVTDTQITVNAAWTVSFAGSNVEGRGGIVFETNNTERMRITAGGNILTSGGNVLIGTTTDSGYKLDVQQGATNAAKFNFAVTGVWGGGANQDHGMLISGARYTSDTNTSLLHIINTDSTSLFRVTDYGKVGIGVFSPTSQLSIKNQISNGLTPVSSYAATSGVDGQNFFNGYYAQNSDGLGPFPRYFDIVSTGSPDGSNGGSNIRFFTNPVAVSSPAVERLRITSTGTVQPGANGTQDLGTSSLRWATVYTSDLSLSNGIGDYTIVEGEHDLFLYNNKNNKVYKFLVEEVDPSTATPKKS